MSIPTIDFAPFMAEEGLVMGDEPTLEQVAVAKAIDKACRDHGFVFLTNFGLEDTERQEIFASSRKLFQLSEQEKLENLSRLQPSTNNMGYAPFASESLNRTRANELKEAFNVRFPPAHHNNLQGCPHAFQNMVKELVIPKMKQVARRYALACALALKLPRTFFQSTLKDMNLCTVRFLHCPPCDKTSDFLSHEEEGEITSQPLRVGEHTDFGIFTLLMHAEHGAQGLQIRSVEGGEVNGSSSAQSIAWRDVILPEGVKGAIVNTGAMMARWTNDHWKATAHRVVVADRSMADAHRYSMAFFVDPDADTIVQVPKSILRPGEAIKYDPISASDYLTQKLRSSMVGDGKQRSDFRSRYGLWPIALLGVLIIVLFLPSHFGQAQAFCGTRTSIHHKRLPFQGLFATNRKTKQSAKDGMYRIQYSPNFHRHLILEKQTTSNTTKGYKVIKSFPWLDEARLAYPTAVPEPLAWSQARIAGVLNETEGRMFYNGQMIGNDEISVKAGQTKAITAYLQSRLMWFPSQVQKLLEIYPQLEDWPASIFQERIEFLLAPLPPSHQGRDVVIMPTDWPQQFYKYGYGAGMSAAQVTHGMLIIPHVLLRAKLNRRASKSVWEQQQMVKFYDETPSVVQSMTRRQLNYFLQGTTTMDSFTYSYLHYKGYEFQQLQILIQAFPATIQTAPELSSSWEMILSSETTFRRTLDAGFIDLFQLNFQMRPIHIKAILQTHSRASLYSAHVMERNALYLSSSVGLKMAQLRSIFFKQPSILGMAIDSLEERVEFWKRNLVWDDAESADSLLFRDLFLEHPTLLAYSVKDNLQPKLSFFVSTLGLSSSQLSRLTMQQPKLWGRSLKDHWIPMTDGLARAILLPTQDDLSTSLEDAIKEIGANILVKAPELFAKYNWPLNLSPKVQYLRQTLGPQVSRRLLLQTARVLVQKQESLQVKLSIINQLQEGDDPKERLMQCPSLLLHSKDALRRRLAQEEQVYEKVGTTNKVKKKDKSIVCLSGPRKEEVVRFPNINEALVHAGVSRGYFYTLLRNEKATKTGYTYKWASDHDSHPNKQKVAAALDVVPQNQLTSSTSASEPLAMDTTLVISVCGQAFPDESILRGRRRAGGMAFGLSSQPSFAWRNVVEQLWNKAAKVQVMRPPQAKQKENQFSNNPNLIVLLGYNFLYPSQTRCGLYAIREALRLARLYCQQQQNRDHSHRIIIETDCNPALNRLLHSTQFLASGTYEGDKDNSFTHSDIWDPLIQAYRRLALEPSVSVEFRKNQSSRLKKAAGLAARHMYESLK